MSNIIHAEGDSPPAGKSVSLTVAPSAEEISQIQQELKAGTSSETAAKVRQRLLHERVGLLSGYFQDNAAPNRLRGLDTLIADNRAALDELERTRGSILNAQREERMLSLSVGQLEQAKALKIATWALVVATVALLLATVWAAWL